MRRLSYANAMSTVAVFLALGGGAWAIGRPTPAGGAAAAGRSLVSPNGRFALTVDNGAIVLADHRAGAQIKLSDGDITIHTSHQHQLTVSADRGELHLQSRGDVAVAAGDQLSLSSVGLTDIHAGKRTTQVSLDDTTQVGRDAVQSVGRDFTSTISRDATFTTHGNQTSSIDKNTNLTIHGNKTEQVDKDVHWTMNTLTSAVALDVASTVGRSFTNSIGVASNTTIGGASNTSIGAAQTTNVGGTSSTAIGGSITTTSHGAITTSADHGISTTAGGALSTNAGSDLSVTAGGDLISSAHNVTTTASGAMTNSAGVDLTNTAAQGITDTTGGKLLFKGNPIDLGGCASPPGVARKGDAVQGGEFILGGSTTVFAC
jgi:hypothetical protein